jgi:hypothetical protein
LVREVRGNRRLTLDTGSCHAQDRVRLAPTKPSNNTTSGMLWSRQLKDVKETPAIDQIECRNNVLGHTPEWTVENRQFVDGAKPAIS